jgi:hypothetical protein
MAETEFHTWKKKVDPPENVYKTGGGGNFLGFHLIPSKNLRPY